MLVLRFEPTISNNALVLQVDVFHRFALALRILPRGLGHQKNAASPLMEKGALSNSSSQLEISIDSPVHYVLFIIAYSHALLTV